MRIVFWNILAGGGKRANAILSHLIAWKPDVIALCEFRATQASQSIAEELQLQGWEHQLTTATEDHRARNALLLASRFPLEAVRVPNAPEPAHRWLFAQVAASVPFHIGVMHIPNMHTGFKYPYHDAVLSLVKNWTNGPAVLIGDTNTGLPEVDEESPAFTPKEAHFMHEMEAAHWHDAFRYLHGDEPAYTWYSPNGRNGFRLDEAFVNTNLIAHVTECRYVWAQADELRQVSDHAAILLDLTLPGPPSGASDC